MTVNPYNELALTKKLFQKVFKLELKILLQTKLISHG